MSREKSSAEIHSYIANVDTNMLVTPFFNFMHAYTRYSITKKKLHVDKYSNLHNNIMRRNLKR